MFDHRVGLPGEQGLVDLQVLGLGDLAVDHHLVAGPELHQIAEDDPGGGDARRDTVPADDRSGLTDDGEPVQGLLGTPFLEDPDAGVGDDHEAEQPVLDRADHQDDQEEHADDGVEAGEDVRPHDFGQ